MNGDRTIANRTQDILVVILRGADIIKGFDITITVFKN